MKRVAILGAGISGLATAWKLRQSGVEVGVFDPSGQPGGVIQSVERGGYLLELGPNTVLEKQGDGGAVGALTELIDGLNLRDKVLKPRKAARKRFILHCGRPVAVPQSLWSFLTTPLLSVKAKVRLLTEPFRSSGRAGDESVAAFFSRRLGTEAMDHLIDPFVSGIYAGDVVRLSARHCFPTLWDWERRAGSLVRGAIGALRARRGQPGRKTKMISFADGLEVLPRELGRVLAPHLFLGVAHPLRKEKGRWYVGPEGPFDAVVTAMPPAPLADLLEEAIPGFSIPGLRTYPRSSVRIWHFGVKEKNIGHPLDGFGVLAPSSEDQPILGVLFSSSIFRGRTPNKRVLLTVFQGGTRHPEFCDAMDESEAYTLAWKATARWLEIEGEPEFRSTTVWRSAIPQYEVGHQSRLDALAALESAHPGLFIGGNLRGGVAVGDCVASAFQLAGRVLGPS